MNVSQQYNDLLPKLKKTLAHIDQILHQEFGDGFVIETSLKTAESTIRKCEDKQCKDINKLSDLIRGRLFFPPSFTYQQVLHRLIKIFKQKIVKIEWKKSYDHGLIYRGILHIDLEINGTTFELQVMPLGFRPFVEPQHKIYALLRDDPKLDENVKKRLIKMHNDMFDMLEDNYSSKMK